MSSIVERTLTFTGSQAKTYMTSTGGVQLADDLAIKSKCIANIEAILSSSASGTAVYNSTSKNILYPNSTAHPIKLTGYFDYYNQNSSTLQLIYNGATILTMPNKNSNTSYSFESVNPAVLSSTKSSDIHWYLKRSSLTSSVYFTDPFAFTLSFARYDYSATAGTGITYATALGPTLIGGGVTSDSGGWSPYYNGTITPNSTAGGYSAVAITNDPSNAYPDGAITTQSATGFTAGKTYFYNIGTYAPAGKVIRISLRTTGGGYTETQRIVGTGSWVYVTHYFTATSEMSGQLEVVEEEAGELCTWYVRALAFRECMNANGFDGDSLGFFAKVDDDYRFDGWFNGDVLVSSSRYFSKKVDGEDLALTAKAHLKWDKSTTCTVKYNNQVLTQFSSEIPISVTYNSTRIHNMGAIRSAELLCAGLYMKSNVQIGSTTLNCNATKALTNISILTTRPYPVGYVPLLYIEATGNQEIVTDWEGNNNTNYEIWYDAQYSAYQPNDRGLQGWSGSVACSWGVHQGSYELNRKYAGMAGTRSKIRWFFPRSTGNAYLSVDGTRILTSGSSTISTGDPYLRYFSLGGSSFMSGRLYGSYVLENGIMTHDYYPVRRTSDSAVGLFDMITGVFLIGEGMSGHEIDNIVPDLSTWTLSGASVNGSTMYFPGGGLRMGVAYVSDPIPGHLYYGRVYEARSLGDIGDARFEYFKTDDEKMTFSSMGDTPADGESHLKSAILSLPQVSPGGWIIRSFVVDNGSIGNVNARKDMMIIDLTETYGAGMEPTKEWLDENLPYIP